MLRRIRLRLGNEQRRWWEDKREMPLLGITTVKRTICVYGKVEKRQYAPILAKASRDQRQDPTPHAARSISAVIVPQQ